MPTLPKVARVALHLGAALLLTMILGFIFSTVLHPSGTVNPWFDPPYSPVWWGTAVALGAVMNRLVRDNSALWIWLGGAAWLSLWVLDSRTGYDARWSYGYSRNEYIWHVYFTNRDCLEECLGVLFATTPAVNSLAYSIGAMLAGVFKPRVGISMEDTP